MARIAKCTKLFFHILLFMTVNYFLNRKQERSIRKVERFLVDLKHLLFWTKFAGHEEGQKLLTDKTCMHINCYLTTNRNLLGDVRHFDAIIFNVEDLEGTSADLPKLRSHVQKYIFAANASSDNYPLCSSVYDEYFNWTWSYRLESSIPFTYVSVNNLNNDDLGFERNWITNMKPIDLRLKSVLQTKTKAAAIFLDKCESTSKRELFLKKLQNELAKYNLTVDVYGKCGTLKCRRRNMKTCYYKVKASYYFYLALEDSIAKDFITGIVLNGYQNNAVPIIYSGADYTRFIPPKSYLDAAKLGEALLAKTMNEIIRNKEWYYDFFRWRNHYVVREGKGMDFCSLCEAMNKPAWLQARVSLPRFRKWWNPNYETRCSRQKYTLF